MEGMRGSREGKMGSVGTGKREKGSEGRWSEGRRELVVRNTSRGKMK